MWCNGSTALPAGSNSTITVALEAVDCDVETSAAELEAEQDLRLAALGIGYQRVAQAVERLTTEEGIQATGR